MSQQTQRFDEQIQDSGKFSDAFDQLNPFNYVKAPFWLYVGILGVICVFLLILFIVCRRGAKAGQLLDNIQPRLTLIQLFLQKKKKGRNAGDHYKVTLSGFKIN